jgi:hypothetical protein
MKQSWPFFVGAIGAAAFLVHTFIQLPSLESGVPVSIEPTVFDAGSVMEGSLAGTFTITNESHDPYRIVSVSKSCDCTNVRAPISILPPAGSLPIDFTWNTLNKQGATESTFIVILSRVIDGGAAKGESQPYHLIARLKADVQQRWWMEPSTLVFRDGASSAVSRIRVAPQVRASLINASCSHQALHAEIVDNGTAVKVTLNRKVWIASASAQVLVSSKNIQKVAMPIAVVVQ